MACRAWIGVFVILFVSGISASESEEAAPSKEFVLTLDHSNFTQTVSKHNFIVVEFYAASCGHCKKLAPEYEKAASILSSHDPPVILAKVNAIQEKNKVLADEFEVAGYPTLKILRKGGKNVQEYKGPRDAEGIVEYLKKQSGPASLELKSVEAASTLIDGKKIVVVGVFPEFSGEKFDTFTALAEKLRSEHEFGHTTDAKILPLGESSVSGPLIRLFKPFDELVVDFQDFSVDALEKFIEEASIATVTEFSNDPNNHPFVIKFFNRPNDKAMLFLNFSSNLIDAFKSNYEEVAKQYKGKGIRFLIGDLEASQRALEYFGLKEDQAPLIIIQTNDGQKYLKQNVKPDHIASWVKEYKDGNVQSYIKSEPIPEVNNEPVKVVVAYTFQEIVFNSGKNVLVEFYAPWCGHCKELAPILDEIAVSFENDADVVISKIDATANEFPYDTFEVRGYPTLYFKTADGNVSPYNGERTKEGIIDFIQKNRVKPAQQETDKPAQQENVKDEL